MRPAPYSAGLQRSRNRNVLVDLLDMDASLNRTDRVGDFEDSARGFFRVGIGAGGGVFHAAALSSLSATRATILIASSGKRPLHRLGLIPRRAHPDVAFLVCQQDDRHGFRVDGFDHGVRRRGEKAVHLMRAGNRFRYRSAVTLELGPDAGEAGQRPIVVDREPDNVLFLGLGIRLRRVFSEAVGRD